MIGNGNLRTQPRGCVTDSVSPLGGILKRCLSCTIVLLASIGCSAADSGGITPSFDAARDNSSALVEITQEVGLDFVHNAGALGDYGMPQIMGSGAAMFDYDGDGNLDILLIDGGSLDPSPRDPSGEAPVTSRLFRQEHDGKFVDVTTSSRLANHGYGMGVAIGDIDNDGDLDVYVTNYGPDRLFQNNGDGTFTDVTQSAGIASPGWSTAACFFDYDRDGWLDLFVVNYLDFFPGSICEDGSGRRDYCGPESFRGTVDRLYRNTSGDSDSRGVSFTDVTVVSGIASQVGRGLGVLCCDMNDDDRPDIYVANDMEPNRLWIQQADGSYVDEAVLRGVATNRLGKSEASMGVARGDLNADGQQDLLLTHLRGETNTLYLAEQSGLFTDGTAASGLGPASLRRTGFGVAAIDLEHDGDLDLVIVNGGVKRGPREGATEGEEYWADYAEPNQVFINTGSGVFLDNEESRTADFRERIEVSRGLSWGDVDNDGDIDLLVTNAGGRARLYRNEFSKQGNWLMIRAVDPSLQRDSIGARVLVQAGSRQFEREVNPSSSYLSSHDLRVHFGLGDAPHYDKIIVHWPGSGRSLEVFPGGEANRMLLLTRGTGRITESNRHPE